MNSYLTDSEVEVMNQFPTLIGELRMTMKLVRYVMVVNLVMFGIGLVVAISTLGQYSKTNLRPSQKCGGFYLRFILKSFEIVNNCCIFEIWKPQNTE